MPTWQPWISSATGLEWIPDWRTTARRRSGITSSRQVMRGPAGRLAVLLCRTRASCNIRDHRQPAFARDPCQEPPHVIDRDPIPRSDATPWPLRGDRPGLGVARQCIGQGRLHHRRIPGNRPGHCGRLRRGRRKGDLSDRTVRAGARTDPGPDPTGECRNTMCFFDVRGHQRGPGRSWGLDLRGKIRRYRRGRCQRRLP